MHQICHRILLSPIDDGQVVVVWYCGGGSDACGGCGGWGCGYCDGGCVSGVLVVAVVVKAFERVAVVMFVVAL